MTQDLRVYIDNKQSWSVQSTSVRSDESSNPGLPVHLYTGY